MENEIIRREINEIIGEEWYEMVTSSKKRVIKRELFMKPDILRNFLKDYKSLSVSSYDFEKDNVVDQIIAKVAGELLTKYPLYITKKLDNSLMVVELICNKFKNLMENNKVSELLYVDEKPRPEKIVQRASFCVVESYCSAYNLDVSLESDAGRGPVDFKMSRGMDKTIIEIKLTTNTKLAHGYKKQVE